MLSFAYPWMLLLLPLPLLAYWLLPAYQEPRQPVRVPFLKLLSRLAGQHASAAGSIYRRIRPQKVMIVLVWLGLATALARPQWIDEPIVKELPMRDLLVAVDLSGSMETRDFTDSSGAVTDRLSAARQVLDDFLSRRDGDRVGLVFFGSAAYVQAPFTEDLVVVRALMDEAQVRMLGPKTMLGDAIGVAINLFERSEVETLSYRPEYELYFWPGGFSLLLSLLFFSVVELRSYRNRQKPAQQNIREAMP